jgi:hypothetical protein
MLIALALLIGVWWTTTAWPWDEVSQAAGRLLERAGATGYKTPFVLAWADGFLGWIGVATIRPGWFTGGASILLAAAWLFTSKPRWLGFKQSTT